MKKGISALSFEACEMMPVITFADHKTRFTILIRYLFDEETENIIVDLGI